MIKDEQDRAAIKRIIRSIFLIEDDYKEELVAIVKDESIPMEERAEKFLDLICDHLEYYPMTDNDGMENIHG